MTATAHLAHLQPAHYADMRAGIKTVEGRLRVNKWATMIEGDTIGFYTGETRTPDPEHVIRFRIMRVKPYDTAEQLLVAEGRERVLPRTRSLEEAVDVYKKLFPDQSAGMVALELHPW